VNYCVEMGSGAVIYIPSFVKRLPLASSRITVWNKVNVSREVICLTVK
jgi:uncharacterized RmlC-like cupin family protein